MSVNIKFFGNLTEVTGLDQITMDHASPVFGSDILKEKLKNIYPALGACKFTVAVNQIVTSGNQDIHDGDEVALLPPYAGG